MKIVKIVVATLESSISMVVHIATEDLHHEVVIMNFRIMVKIQGGKII